MANQESLEKLRQSKKDGLARDLERWKIEWHDIKVFTAADVKRFRWTKPHRWPHLTTNLVVEAAKVAPWFVGHVAMIQAVANMSLNIALAWALVHYL